MMPVLATVLLDPPTALLFGSGLAIFSTQLLRKDPAKETAKVGWISGLWGVYYCFCVTWMFVNKTDWMLVYLVDSTRMPFALGYGVFLVLCGFFGVLGGLATSWLVVQRGLGLAIAFFFGCLLTVAAIGALQADAYVHVGTLAEYRAGTAPAIPDLPEMQRAMNFSGLFAAPVAFGLLFWRLFKGRKA